MTGIRVEVRHVDTGSLLGFAAPATASPGRWTVVADDRVVNVEGRAAAVVALLRMVGEADQRQAWSETAR